MPPSARICHFLSASRGLEFPALGVLVAAPNLILLFASRSEEGGRPVAGEDPRFRLPEAEYRLLDRAAARGYRVLRTTDLGPCEKAVWVAKR